MQEMAEKENLPCDGHRGGRAQTSGASLIGSAGPGPGKDESPAWGKRGSLMGVKLGDFKELDASGRKWFNAKTAEAAASLPGRPALRRTPACVLGVDGF